MLGYRDSVYQIEISNGVNIKNINLVEKSVELETVEIYADKIDIAKKVIKATSKNKKINGRIEFRKRLNSQ